MRITIALVALLFLDCAGRDDGLRATWDAMQTVCRMIIGASSGGEAGDFPAYPYSPEDAGAAHREPDAGSDGET